MNTKGIVWREIALWIMAIILVIVILMFLMNLPFLRWVGYLPGDEEKNDSLDERVDLDEETVSNLCPKEKRVARLSQESGGNVGGVFSLGGDERQIIFNDGETLLYISGDNLESAKIYVAGFDEQVGSVANGKIYFEGALFNESSDLRANLWFEIFSKLPYIYQEEFNEWVIGLEGAEILDLETICGDENGAQIENKFERGEKINEDELRELFKERTDYKEFLTEKEEGIAWYWYDGWISNDYFAVLFRDGSVWVKEDYVNSFRIENLDFGLYRGMGNFNGVEDYGESDYFQTNLYVNEDDLGDFFNE